MPILDNIIQEQKSIKSALKLLSYTGGLNGDVVVRKATKFNAESNVVVKPVPMLSAA